MPLDSTGSGRIFSAEYWRLRSRGLNDRESLTAEEQTYAEVVFPDGGEGNQILRGRGIGRDPTYTEWNLRDNPRRRG